MYEGGESGHEHTKNMFIILENRWNYTNFERNLAMMVIHLPVESEFD